MRNGRKIKLFGLAAMMALAACDEEVPPPAGEDVPPPANRVEEPMACDGEIHTFTAHPEGVRNRPYQVGEADDAYVNFTFRSPWQGQRWALWMKPVIDNDQVLHHWLFYQNSNAAGGDLRVSPSVGVHLGGELVIGWAPGGEAMVFDEGLAMPFDEGFYNLEVHYNSSDANAVDASGVTVCVTDKKPEHEVGNSWLGTDGILGDSATGTCIPDAQTEPIHIIAVNPHMHTKGRWMKSVINRADGTQDILHDAAFNFDSQVTWKKDIVIYPGDSIVTKCYFSEPAIFGTSTNAEMCYLYTKYWPNGALRDRELTGIIHGRNTCLGPLISGDDVD